MEAVKKPGTASPAGKLNANLLIELAMVAAILLGLNHLLFTDAILNWNPSPLWFLVLFVAMRHGSPAGIVGGVAAAVIYLAELTRLGHSFQELMHLNPAMLLIPTLFIFVGMSLGETREHLAKRGDHFRLETLKLNGELDTNEARRMSLERANLELQKRIAGQTNTLLGVHANLNRLDGAKTEAELWNLLTGIVQTELRAECSAVWRIGDGEILAVTGAAIGQIPPLARLAARRRGLVTVGDWLEAGGGDEPPGAELATILTEDRDNQAVLTASGLAFGNLNRGSIVFFDLVARRAEVVCREIRRLESFLRITISNQELGLSSESYLRNRVREEAMLSRRHKTELALLAGAIARDYPKGMWERMEVIVSCAIRASVRSSDGVAFFGREKAFVIVLPGSNEAGAAIVANKVAGHLEQLRLIDPEGNPAPELAWNALRVEAGEREEEIYRKLFAKLSSAPGTRGGSAA
jgi:hypothetical protein